MALGKTWQLSSILTKGRTSKWKRSWVIFHGCFSRHFSTSIEQDWDSEQWQYLERNRLPTYYFQRSLRRLSIPKLEKSCERYLTALRPIASDELFSNAQRLVSEFQTGDGQKLHKELVDWDAANPHTSYIAEKWFDIYLRARVPSPVHYAPFMTFAPDPHPDYNTQILRATNLSLSIGRFKKALDEEVLGPEIFHLNPKRSKTPNFELFCKLLPERIAWYGAVLWKAFPLDMSQFPSLFNSTRIPCKDKDEILGSPGGRHIMVMRRGHIFSVDLFRPDGALLRPTELYACFLHVLSQPLEENESPVGVFSCMPRDDWAALRERLLETEQNRVSLEAVDGALFTLCLDEAVPWSMEAPQPLIRNLLHADGVNRWFDKSFQLIVTGEGLACVNFEHAWGDGVAVLRMMEEIQRDTTSHHFVSPSTRVPDGFHAPDFVRKLEFTLSNDLKNDLVRAKADYKKLCDKLDFGALEFRDMNKDYLKRNKLSPDAVMQLAIQCGYHRMYGRPSATYESCSTSAFLHGRTETMRPATSATKRCVQALLSAQPPPVAQLRQMINDCSKLHSQLVKEASLGQGFDRHFLGMRDVADRLGVPQPAIFEDESWRFANHFILCTSTLSTETVILGGFGPVVEDGLGIGYNVGKKRLGTVVSANSAFHNPREVTDAIHASLNDIFKVIHATES